MQIDRVTKREQKRHKAKHGMRVTGKSVFVILQALDARADEIRANKEKRENAKKK